MIRVLRMMEYEFEDYEHMEKSIEKWAVPANGKINFGRGRIRSATIDSFEKDDEDGKKYQEIMDLVANDSLARDGWEMIESAARDKASV